MKKNAITLLLISIAGAFGSLAFASTSGSSKNDLTLPGGQELYQGKEIAIPFSLISIAGGLGGLAFAFTSGSSKNELTLPGGQELYLGFIGDVISGAAAALAMYAFAGPLLSVDITNLGEPSLLFKVIGISVIAGFAGISLLRKLSSSLSAEAVKVNEKIDKISEAIDRRENSEDYVSQGDMFAEKKEYPMAISYYNKAIKVDATNKEAYVQKGRALKRKHNYKEAIECINEALNIDPSYERALYNRACYRTLNGEYMKHKNLILDDLKKSIQYFSDRKIHAQKESDFDSIKDDNDFLEIIKE